MKNSDLDRALRSSVYPFETGMLACEEEQLRTVLKSLADVKHALDQSSIVAITDRRGEIIYVNDRFCEISHYSRKELLGQDHRILNSGYHPKGFFKAMWADIGRGKVWRNEIRNKAKDGSFYWVDTTIVPFLNENGVPYQYISIRNDITSRKLMEEALKKSEERYRLITENSSDLISVVDDQANLCYISPAHRAALGLHEQQMESLNLLSILHEDDRERVRYTLARSESGPFAMEFRIKHADGYYIDVESSFNLISQAAAASALVFPDQAFRAEAEASTAYDDRLQKYVLVMRDITERKRTEQKIYYLAYHDTLTELPNRRLFMEKLQHAVIKAKREKTMLGVLFLDLDRFKSINDSFGHEIGDVCLIEAAQRIGSCIASKDILARLGGDEFTVLIPDIRGQEELASLAERIQLSLEEPVQIEDWQYHLSCSIGISIYPEDGHTPDDLLKHADTALYAAKEQGRNGYSFFHKEMEERSLERILLEIELKKAIAQKQFYIDYQPKIDLLSGSILGVEALVRWRHEELGVIPPNKFIPIAEESGLIMALGDWVLEEACRQNKYWQDQGYPELCMAVNLSVRQFYQMDLADKISRVLTKTGLDAQYLELEVTESVFASMDNAAEVMQAMKSLGIRLSIDDFGTGYSSLHYIKEMPIDVLKIDMSFIRDLHCNKESQAIVKAILDMAQSLQLSVVAEGIEYQEQLDILRTDGCNLGQGYLFSRPLSPDNFEKFLLK